jgi:hypothetical protein
VWGDAEEYRWIFDIAVQNGELVSEDNIVCDKLRAAGIPTWVDPSIVIGHHGPKRYAGDFRTWLAQQIANERAAGVNVVPLKPQVRETPASPPQAMRPAE